MLGFEVRRMERRQREVRAMERLPRAGEGVEEAVEVGREVVALPAEEAVARLVGEIQDVVKEEVVVRLEGDGVEARHRRVCEEMDEI